MSVSKVLGFIKKADSEFGLIENGDKIAVGLSGGKDSIVLLYALHLYKFFSKKEYQIIGLTIDVGFEGMDFSPLKEYCESLNIPYYVKRGQPNIIDVLNLHVKDGKLSCSICSKMKKAAMLQESKLLGCNKVAFGHHGDDAIATLFLNAIYGGRIATFPPKIYLSNTDMTLIRPLIYLFEKDVIKAFKEVSLPIVTSTCRNDKHTEREEINNLLKSIYKTHPKAHKNFLLMLNNPQQQELWYNQLKLMK